MQKIIRHTFILGLIALMSFKIIGGFSYNLYFWWNQKQLAAEHCVNKQRPQMKCNGKCYLAKQLAKIENDYQKKQRQPAPFQLKAAELYPSPSALNFMLVSALPSEKEQPYFNYSGQLSGFDQHPTSPPPEFG